MAGASDDTAPGTNSTMRTVRETIENGILPIKDRDPATTSEISTQTGRRDDNVAPAAARNNVAV